MFQSKLVDIKDVAENSVEFYLNKPAGYIYKSGQHTSVTISNAHDEGNNSTHTFSYTSAPKSDKISFLTRIRDSEFKKALSKSRIGDMFEISSPSGFKISEGLNEKDNFLYYAAGVGITPLLSYIRSIEEKSPTINLVWSNKSKHTTPYYESFSKGSISKLNQLNTQFYFTAEENGEGYSVGRLNISEISKHLEKTEPRKVYIIGMPAFVDDIWSLVLSTGYSDEKVITENFSGY